MIFDDQKCSTVVPLVATRSSYYQLQVGKHTVQQRRRYVILTKLIIAEEKAATDASAYVLRYVFIYTHYVRMFVCNRQVIELYRSR